MGDRMSRVLGEKIETRHGYDTHFSWKI